MKTAKLGETLTILELALEHGDTGWGILILPSTVVHSRLVILSSRLRLCTPLQKLIASICHSRSSHNPL